jgi:enoyl-CoA hydratase
MKNDAILYEVDKEKGIATITFNRPEKLNCLRFQEFKEFADLLEEPQADDNVKVIILKGNGSAFCAGADVGKLSTDLGFKDSEAKKGGKRASQRVKLLADDKMAFGPRGMQQAVLGCNKATIAQVHGYAYGAGFHIALACDMTISAEGCMFSHSGYRLMGPSAEGSAVPLFMNVGPKKAMELMLTGRPIEAVEAERLGIINSVVPADKLEAEVMRYAQTIALLSLDGIVIGKYATRAALDRLGYFGYLGVICHNMGTNIVWDDKDFNWFKENKNRGTTEAIKYREARYAALGMDIASAKKKAGVTK